MKRAINLGIIISIMLISANYLLAQPKMGKGNNKRECVEKLNLTDSQKAKFDEIRFDFQEKKIDLETALKKNRLEIKKIMRTDNINESELMNNIDKGSALIAEKRKSKVKMWLTIKNILDDDQKKIWANHFQNFKMKNGNFSGKGGKRGKRFLNHNCEGNFGNNNRRFNN